MSKILHASKVRGFSLVEMLIYIAILVLMLTVIMNVVVSVIRSGRIIKSLRNVENSAIVSIERLTRELRQAESINVGLSTLNSNPGRLVLESTDDIGTPRTVEFYLFEDRILLKENGVDIGALTQMDARVSNLIFYRFSDPNSEGIRTEMTIESGTSTHYRSEKFYSSALLR
ncbi:MAG: prepilin-type N-terminal cleavage/methylation domain-containing protein [bacterium]|nr:prepilin-type N-terminal cleavage/methylation domain-containing protein [bacterium]